MHINFLQKGSNMVMEVGTMESKTNHQIVKPTVVQTKDKTAQAGQLIDFFAAVKTEFKKIVWTNPNELRTYTKIVVAMTVLFGLGIYVMDIAIQLVLGFLGAFLQLIGI
jgi:preprotein translocase subunit SecE